MNFARIAGNQCKKTKEAKGMDEIAKTIVQTLNMIGTVLTTLKLCDVIDWSWWLVLLPFYSFWAFALTIYAIDAVYTQWIQDRH